MSNRVCEVIRVLHSESEFFSRNNFRKYKSEIYPRKLPPLVSHRESVRMYFKLFYAQISIRLSRTNIQRHCTIFESYRGHILFSYRIRTRSNKIVIVEKCRYKFHIFYLLMNRLPEHQLRRKQLSFYK